MCPKIWTDKTELEFYFQGKRNFKPCDDMPIFISKAYLYRNGIVKLVEATPVFVSIHRTSFLDFSMSIQPAKSQYSPLIMDKHPINENVIVSRQYWNPQCRKKTKSVGVEFLNLTDKQRSAYDQMKIEFYNCVNYKCFVMLYKSIRKIGDYVMYDTIQYHPEDKSTPSDNCNELRYNLERQCKMLAPYWEPATLSDSDYVESD